MEGKARFSRTATTRFLFAALFCALTILGSPVLAFPDRNETGSISGRVTDENGAPVPEAIVTIRSERIGAVTDSTGTFTLRSIPVGTFTLRAAHIRAGHSEKAGVQVTADKTTAVDFALTWAADVKAPVFTEAYEPCDDPSEAVSGEQSLVQIGVRSEKRAGSRTYIYKVLNRSSDTLREVRIGYEIWHELCELTGASPNVVPDTAFGPPGWICTPVQALDPKTFALAWKVAPSTDGSGIPPNSSLSGFTVTLRKRDPLYLDCHWLVKRGYYAGRVKPWREVDKAATGTIAGRVTDQGGRPLSGAIIHTWHAGLRTASTSDGTYMIAVVPVGEYTLMADMSGHQRCGKGHVRVTAGHTARADFHLSSGAWTIPCTAYTTRRERVKAPFPRGAVDTHGAQFLDRGMPIPPRLPGEASRSQPYIYSLTGHDVEVIYRGLGQDTATKAFVATVHREFRDPAEERLLRIAEETYPPPKAIASIANDRIYRKSLLREKWLWWYGDFDGVRLPYAVTTDAVRYYLGLTQALGRGESSKAHVIRMKRSRFSYSARVSAGPTKTFSREGQVFENVYIVEMRLEWSNYCGSLCACDFHLERTVVLRADGTVVCVFGDRKPMVVVS